MDNTTKFDHVGFIDAIEELNRSHTDLETRYTELEAALRSDETGMILDGSRQPFAPLVSVVKRFRSEALAQSAKDIRSLNALSELMIESAEEAAAAFDTIDSDVTV